MSEFYKREYTTCDCGAIIDFECHIDRIKELEAENKKLRECVEYYASKDNWFGGNVSIFREEFGEIDDIDWDQEIREDGKTLYKTGGKGARSVLHELDNRERAE